MRLGGFKLPMETLSATSIAKAVSCPEAWRRRYICKQRDGFGVDRFVGTVDHETIAAALDVKLKTGVTWDTEYLTGAYDWFWGTELEKEQQATEHRIPWGVDSPEKLIERGKLMVETYWNLVGPEIEPIAVEQRFEEMIPGIPVPLIGYVDAELEHVIIERKTSKTKLSKPKPTWAFQARVYQLFVPKEVHWHIVTKQVTPQVVLGGVELPGLVAEVKDPDMTVKVIQQTVHQLNDFYERYGPDESWPTTGIFHDWLCGFCQHGPSMKSDCAAWRTKGSQ